MPICRNAGLAAHLSQVLDWAGAKEPLTGIVKHLDDQCIGCKYCTLMCPYDVPHYNQKQGIVRKCDMCSILRGEPCRKTP